jgi:PAS domain S-box-containing protein
MKTLFEGKKLYAVMIASLFVVTFFITVHIIRNHYQYVVKNTIDGNKLKARFLSSLLYEHQKAAISILESYAQRLLLIDAVKKKDFHRALYHLKSLSEHHSEIDALVLYDQYGTIWANYPVSKEGFGKNLAYRDWYKGVSKKWRPYISSVYRLIVLEKGLAVAVSVPVFDRKGKVIGILSSAQRTAFLDTFIKDNIIDPEKNITLLDQEGNIIFSNAVPYQEKITKYPDAHVLEKALAGVFIDMEIAHAKEKGSISYVSIAPVRGIGWSVIVGQEKNAILKSLYRYFSLSAVAGVVIFLFLTVSLLYFRREYRYRKTKELQESEERLRTIVEASLDAIMAVNAEGRLVLFNGAAQELFQYSEEEALNQPVDILLREEIGKIHQERLEKFLKRGVGQCGHSGRRMEKFFRRKDGSLFVAEVSMSVGRLDGLRLVVLAIHDITDRKRGEEALRESEQSYRLLATYHKRLNDISIAFTEASGTEDLFNRIAESFRLLTDAIAATFSVYNQETRALKVVSLSIDPISSGKVGSIFGPELFEMRMPVSADDMEHMLSQGIRRPKDLCELSFGVMPQDISDAVMDAVGCRQVVALAIRYAEELVGTCVVYLPGDQPVVPDDALKTYIYLSGLAVKRRQAEEALRESEARYRSLFENNHAVMLLIDPDNAAITDANPAACAYYGWSREELKKRRIDEINTLTSKEVSAEMQLALSEKRNQFFFKHRRADGTIRDVEVYSGPILLKGKFLLYSIVHDITERKQAEEKILASLREKEILLMEVHHRVKNNMQVISGLLDLQASSSGNPELIERLNESQSRIRSMALIHEKLYESKDFARIDLAGYVRTLSQDLFQSYKINPGKIDLIVQPDGDVYVDINKAIPCGLILNELISNALKHAFPRDRHGELQIIIRETKNTEIEILLRDNGLGLPDDVDIHQPRTVGLHLVNGLVKNQLDGQMEVRRDNGTEFRIKFPL